MGQAATAGERVSPASAQRRGRALRHAARLHSSHTSRHGRSCYRGARASASGNKWGVMVVVVWWWFGFGR